MFPRMLHIWLPLSNACSKTCVPCPMHISNCRPLRCCYYSFMIIRIISNIQTIIQNSMLQRSMHEEDEICGKLKAVKWLPIQFNRHIWSLAWGSFSSSCSYRENDTTNVYIYKMNVHWASVLCFICRWSMLSRQICCLFTVSDIPKYLYKYKRFMCPLSSEAWTKKYEPDNGACIANVS